MLQIGDNAPDFTATADSGEKIRLKDLRGKKVILYFYPKDDTPGCTREACNFRDLYARFKKKNVVVLGVSVDSAASHAKFKSKYGLPFPLISDEDHKIVEAYGVWKEKSMYGKKYMGTERTTFLIDEKGKIARIYEKVKVDGHADALLEAVSEK
ncbi:MAG TPA: thioredoxin-dependent thiol peroxidase [Bryobacterales bacterium]|jgi:peroxiredoxin Q/BCP|nr:thioredoxin-dependent thiol peroxidase [Bryobacterales bacterium]